LIDFQNSFTGTLDEKLQYINH